MSTETLTSASSRSLAGIPSRTTDFTFPTQPTGTNTSGGNNNGGNNGFNGGTNGTLYLFTFLTTLLLLLAVSCGIVVRSFILRRRFHRRVEEAIAAGVLLPSQTGDINMGPGGTIHVLRRHIGEKPKMWEVWINERSSDEKRGLATSEWSSIQPVAATQISETLAQSKFEQAQNAHTPSAPTSLLGRITDHLPFSRASGRRDTPINAASAPLQATLPSARYGTSPVSVQPPVETAEPPKKPLGTQATGGNQSVQVAVLIAMPDPSRPRYIPGPLLDEHNSEDEGVKGKQRSVELPPVSNEEHELPEVCIGVAQAQIAPSNSAPAEQSPKAPKP